MYSVNFHTTSDARFPPPTLPANYTWDDLQDFLAREIGPGVAALLAEPRYDAGRGETHWYVETDNDPIPFAKLDEPGRAALKSKLAAIQGKVETRFAALAKSSNEKARRQAEALRLVVVIPDDSCLWSLDGEPLLSCWGRRPIVEGHAARKIVRTATAQAPSAVEANTSHAIVGTAAPAASGKPASTEASLDTFAAASAAVTGTRATTAAPRLPSWLWALFLWLLFVALILTGYARLLAACGLALPGQPAVCLFDPRDDRAASQTRNNELRQALRDKAARIAALAPCPSDGSRNGAPDRAETEKRLHEGQLAHGTLDVSLAWNGHADLDLHVLSPCGEIMFSDRTSCGGQLDRDANNSDSRLEDRPVEHVRWDADLPKGHYQIVVVYFARRDAPHEPVPFTVIVRDSGQEQTYSGVLTSPDERKTVVEFDR